ncbi:hypothetical protein HanPSC8_Chr09g0385711 [Helianthus annuus]|nr:hypothetical protein HanPSC8_Chr09g0385711 [Helianthus annuus]
MPAALQLTEPKWPQQERKWTTLYLNPKVKMIGGSFHFLSKP